MGEGVGATIAAGGDFVGPGLGFCSGVENAGRMLGVEVTAVATLAAAVACVPGVTSTPGAVDGARMLGVEVAAVVALTAGVDRGDSGVSSAPGVGDNRRTLEFEVTVLGAVFVRSDCVDGTSKIVFSIPYAERKITISETQLIMLPLSLRLGFRCMPSEGPTVFCGNARSGVFS